MSNQHNQQKRAGTGVWQTLKSVAAAGFGVQSAANRERDFKHGKASHFVITGILATLVLLLTIAMLVKVVIALNS